jgi:hypothetical protein
VSENTGGLRPLGILRTYSPGPPDVLDLSAFAYRTAVSLVLAQWYRWNAPSNSVIRWVCPRGARSARRFVWWPTIPAWAGVTSAS